MKAVVIHNPQSGSALSRSEFGSKCNAAGIKVVEFIDITSGPKKKLTPYLNQSEIVIIGYGGDGTLNSIAALLQGASSRFAPIPGGTLNHFTKDLGIPQDVDEALGRLRTAKLRRVDVGMVNGRVFLNNSSIGLYPATLKTREELEDTTGKWIAAAASIIKAFARYRRMTIEVEDERLKTPFVFVGNNDYKIEKSLIGDRTRLDGNVLSSYAVLSGSRLSLIALLFKSLTGDIKQSNNIKIWKPQQITIRPKRSRVAVSLDGERVIIETPLEYSVIPKSLHVLS